MNEAETQRLLEKFKSLPQQMKEAIVSTDIDNAVLDIAKKHSLLLPEAGQLDNEIVMVLIGEKQASDFIKNIEKEIGFPKNKATAVGKDVNEMIFEKIRSQMKASAAATKPDEPKPEPQKVEIRKTPEQSTSPQPESPPAVEQPLKVEKAGPEKQSLGISPTEPEPQKENIEKPEQEKIAEQKLNSTITTPAKEIQKGPEEKSGPDAGSSKIDPYREPIE